MSDLKSQVMERLRRVKGPDLDGNIVDLGLVSDILIKDGRVYFSITVPASRAEELEPLRGAAEKVVKEIEGVAGVVAVLTAEAAPGREPPQPKPSSGNGREHPRVTEARARGTAGDAGHRPLQQQAAAPVRQTQGVPGVKHIVAVASGKGGVGKSTVAANLALGFQAIGLKAGIMDADIYGPSQPRLLGITGKPEASANKKLLPMEGYGIKAMSMGFMVEEGTPIVWRGPMVVGALNQMLREVLWGDLDVLVIDMPPGTGDVQLTIAQQVPLSGAVIVSTPQDLALIDARKGLAMFRKVNVPLLGIVENMSYFIAPDTGARYDIFGHGGAKAEAEKLEVPFLGEVPLTIEVRETSDSGRPVTATAPDSPSAQIFREIAAKAWSELERAAGRGMKPPKLEIVHGGEALHVTFATRDDHELSAEFLRVLSPSAEVQGHSKDQRVTVGGKKNVKIRELRGVGNYAVRIVFDDGHDTGLYTWSYLHMLSLQKDKRWGDYLAELKAKKLSR
ncbi:MAG: P-loop NTPase [Hyphomicrobium zavarzinii]|uniref:P-loop NTPase n=1 Tax=Hyphomicrobium zavarzinii TaxID=48292 RepID=UPI001A5296AC|nr:P-loop NTPase [Hyphomicrobium zavarzinii]MBL8847612.1 P-loop NTPase [Hyphomicrobium zavarzinii]